MSPPAKQILVMALLAITLCSSSFLSANAREEIILAEGTPINVITAQENSH